MNIDITQIVVAVIGLLSVIVTSVVVPLLKKKLGAEKVSEIQKWVEIAVHAAEQIFSDTGMGKQKKEYEGVPEGEGLRRGRSGHRECYRGCRV